jgi:hypothetical protein
MSFLINAYMYKFLVCVITSNRSKVKWRFVFGRASYTSLPYSRNRTRRPLHQILPMDTILDHSVPHIFLVYFPSWVHRQPNVYYWKRMIKWFPLLNE